MCAVVRASKFVSQLLCTWSVEPSHVWLSSRLMLIAHIKCWSQRICLLHVHLYNNLSKTSSFVFECLRPDLLVSHRRKMPQCSLLIAQGENIIPWGVLMETMETNNWFKSVSWFRDGYRSYLHVVEETFLTLKMISNSFWMFRLFSESYVSLDPKLAWCSLDLETAWLLVFIE